MNLLSSKKYKRESRDTKTVVIVDCSSIIYASFYTMGNLSYNGKQTGVIYGFLKKLLVLARKFHTTDFIFCWDAGVTHRHQRYQPYKQNRHTDMTLMQQEDREDMLIQSMELQEWTLPKLGFHNSYIFHLWEADDLIAHWVRCMKHSRDVIVVSGDSDMYQLLDECRIWNPQQKKMITKKTMMERYGVTPLEWITAKAIGGCQGDNVKGIEGVADPKYPTSKALKYIRGELTKGVVLDRIESPEGRKIIERNLPLIHLPYPNAKMPTMIRRRNLFTRKKFLRIFDHYHFISFLEKDNFVEWEEIFLEG